AGHANLSLDAASIAAAGELTERGGLTAALDDALITATADIEITGQFALDLDAATLSADGGPVAAGALSRAIGDAALSATGTVFFPVTGALTLTLGPARLSG